MCELRYKDIGRKPSTLHFMVPRAVGPFSKSDGVGPMTKQIFFIAMTMSIAWLFGVMLWAQAGRFEAKEAVYIGRKRIRASRLHIGRCRSIR